MMIGQSTLSSTVMDLVLRAYLCLRKGGDTGLPQRTGTGLSVLTDMFGALHLRGAAGVVSVCCTAVPISDTKDCVVSIDGDFSTFVADWSSPVSASSSLMRDLSFERTDAREC